MHELGILEEFLKRSHQEVRQLRGWVGDEQLTMADFTHLPTHCRFLALMPQWDFLDFIAEQARRYPTFHLMMQTDVAGLLEQGGRVTGVRANTPDGPLEVRAELVVGADGRHSAVRDLGGLEVIDLGAPMDVLWMRLSHKSSDPDQTFGRFTAGKILVMLNRQEYWQCGYVIHKGGHEEIRKQGLEAFRQALAEAAPFLNDRVTELRDWDQIKLLTVKVDRLRRWYRAGLLCIGDAAHAMSPVGGVGINLAIQDAVAAANILSGPLRAGGVGTEELVKVQRRRTFPTVMTQRLQIFIQNNLISAALARRGTLPLPWVLRLFRRWTFLQRIPARVVGLGFRPEHVRSPAV
jgi:2-polyprenyl-6-methoxyphenol hydroxylase-like FAD-dependent oxidoreductase